MAGEDDLVSQIKVTGGPEAAAQIEQFADKGAAAFEKVDAASKAAAAGVSASTQRIGASGADAAAGLAQIKGPDLTKFAGGLSNIEGGMRGLTNSIKPAIQAIGRFTQRVALVGTATAAAGIAVVEGARRIALSVGQQTSATETNVKAQQTANDRMAAGQVAAIQLAASQDGLRRQLIKGEITYSEYGKAIKESNEEAQRQYTVQLQVEAAQDRAKEANERLQKSLENSQAMQKLIDKFGGPLTSALIQFGNQAESVRQRFVQAFGPGLAAAVDVVGNVLSKNSGAIQKFLDEAGGKLSEVITKNAPAIESALASLGSAFASVFTGLLEAAPSILAFFNEGVVPAVRAVRDALNGLAGVINSVFGTQITGGTIAFIALFLQLTGVIRIAFTAFRLLFNGGRLLLGLFQVFFGFFGIWGVLILALAAALIYLATKVDWSKFLENAKKAVDGTIAFFSTLPAKIGAFFTDMWNGIKALASSAAQGVTDAWQAVLDFFTSFPGNLTLIFTTLWGLIVAGATVAVQAINDAWNGLLGFFTALGTQIGTFFTTAWETVKNAAGTAVQFITDQWNAFVAFIQTLPAVLGQVWTDITQSLSDAFNSAVEKVKGYLISLRDAALSYLKPIMDLINAILGSGTLSGGGGNTVNAASGGHIRGAGTETSDSILARLSNNEFVVRAAAVRKYGVNLFHQLNSGRFRMPQFSMGGLNLIGAGPVRSSFADGGPVVAPQGMQPLNLTLFGEEFRGLLMPEDTASKMTRFAIGRATRSAGRKPSWVGGKR